MATIVPCLAPIGPLDPEPEAADNTGSGVLRPAPGQATITILLSTHNGDRHLGAQLQSIADQTDRDWRLLVHDDGSTDGTRAVAARFCASDERIEILPRLTNTTNTGSVAEIYLRLLAVVETPFFAFADQDDVWLPDKLANQRAHLKAAGLADGNRVAMVACDAQPVDDRLRPSGATVRRRQSYRSFAEVTLARLLMANPIPGNTIMGTRALAQMATAGAGRAPMHDWWVTLCAAAHDGLIGIESTGVLYRQHDANAFGTPPGLADRVRNLNRRPLVERTAAILKPVAAQAALARSVWPTPLVERHDKLLAAVAACGDEATDLRRALMTCWLLGAQLRPWPSHLALINGAKDGSDA